ncbi:hypothetical protein D3C72_1423310 [compost metagenome]
MDPLQRDGIRHVSPVVVVANRVIDVAAGPRPVVGGGRRRIHAAQACAQVLADVQVEAAAHAAIALVAVVARHIAQRHRIAQAQVAAGGIAVSQKRKVRATVGQVFAVGEPVAGAGALAFQRHLGAGGRHVRGKGAQGGAHRRAQQHRAIVVGKRQAAVAGHGIAHATFERALQHIRRGAAQARVGRPASRQAVLGYAGPQ